MENVLSGKKILLVQGSSLSSTELMDALRQAGAKPYPTSSILSAFGLLERVKFDGALIDRGLHNEAFDLCDELRELNVPYVSCTGPHRLHGPAAREREARHAVWKLETLLSSIEVAGGLPLGDAPTHASSRSLPSQ